MAAMISLGAYLINQNTITFKDFFMYSIHLFYRIIYLNSLFRVFDAVALTARIASQTLTL